MKPSTFFSKLFSLYLWGHLAAMALVAVAVAVGAYIWLGHYTRHGEDIAVPDLHKMKYENAITLLESQGLNVQVADSGYNKLLPANCILAQNPAAGTNVKAGHIIYITINTKSSPALAIPDIIDNSSMREAEAKLRALGFRLLDPEMIAGEKDWVYGVKQRGKSLATGDMAPVDVPLRLVVGSGTDEEDDSIGAESIEDSEMDDFEEITDPLE